MADIDKLAVGAVEDLLRGFGRTNGALHLTFGDGAGFEDATGDLVFISEAERDKALGLGSVWTLVTFPAGEDHIVRRAASLASLLVHVAEDGVG